MSLGHHQSAMPGSHRPYSPRSSYETVTEQPSIQARIFISQKGPAHYGYRHEVLSDGQAKPWGYLEVRGVAAGLTSASIQAPRRSPYYGKINISPTAPISKCDTPFVRCTTVPRAGYIEKQARG